MARKFTSKEAQSIITRAKDDLADISYIVQTLEARNKSFLEKCEAFRASYERQCLQSIRLIPLAVDAYASCIRKGPKQEVTTLYAVAKRNRDALITTTNGRTTTVRECCERALAEGTPQGAAFEDAICAAHHKVAAEAIAQQDAAAWEQLAATLQSSIDEAEIASHGITWYFQAKNSKEAAEQALRTLCNIQDRPTEQQPYVIRARLEAAAPGRSTILELYHEDPDRYLNLIEHAIGIHLGSGSTRPFTAKRARELFHSLNNLHSSIDTLTPSRARLRADVKFVIDRCLDDLTLAALDKLPLEELRHAKTRVNLKALQRAGFTSLKRVYERRNTLNVISGIGPQSAQAIKRFINDLYKRLRETASIRVDVDHPTDETTALIRAIRVYRDSDSVEQQCERLNRLLSKFKSQCKNELSIVFDDIDWLLADEADMAAATRVKNQIEALLNDPRITWINVPSGKLRGKLKQTAPEKSLWKAFAKDPVPYYSIIEEIAPDALSAKKKDQGLPPKLIESIKKQSIDLTGLRCTLRRYQEWGVRFILRQRKVLLGDEMGLGKTIQAIAAMVSLRNRGETHFLVVCPASVLINWCREIEKHSDLTAIAIQGYARRRPFETWQRQGGVAVVTYDSTAGLTLPDNFTFGMLVADEAHYVKNPQAKRTKNTIELATHTSRVLYMTGTALENRVDEMLELIRQLKPTVARKARSLAAASSSQGFRDAIAPVYYRRKREDVLAELPELVETREWCELGPEERSAYERSVLGEHFMAARRVSWNISDLAQSSKAKRLKEIVEEAADDGRKVLVFSFFLDTMEKVCELFGDRCLGYINGSVPSEAKQKLIDRFETAEAGSVLALQIQSGGTGLNIQSASVVVICEPQFKPSTESQAISRAYRMGQTRTVFAHRLLAVDTVDERVTKLLEQKQLEFDTFADKSTSAARDRNKEAQLDKAGFKTLMEEEKSRIQQKNASSVNSLDQAKASNDKEGRHEPHAGSAIQL